MERPDGVRVREARAEVAEGHRRVGAGDYPAAIARFRAAGPVLQAALGADHPEVVELLEDLRAVEEMQGVQQWGQEMGFRGFGGPSAGGGDDTA